jgi:hypothetical protein
VDPASHTVDCCVESVEPFVSPLAYFTVGFPAPIQYPVIFDTGASLAITPDKSDFNGPLTVPAGNLWLGGMANGLRIEGIGTITWFFRHTDRSDVELTGSAYYVPGAKA